MGSDALTGRPRMPVAKKGLVQFKEVPDNEEFR